MSETSPENNIINNEARLIILVMETPNINTEAETEDRIPDGNTNLQGPSNSNTENDLRKYTF